MTEKCSTFEKENMINKNNVCLESCFETTLQGKLTGKPIWPIHVIFVDLISHVSESMS